MAEVITYQRPWPEMTSRAVYLTCCPSTAEDRDGRKWFCTRERGHEDNHEAGNPSGQKRAEWS